MQTASRKRSVSSCIACYTRKQKCNRQYPCNHCARRRRPEQCAYYSPRDIHSTVKSAVQVDSTHVDGKRTGESLHKDGDDHKSLSTLSDLKENKNEEGPSSLVEHFGYFEESRSNTIALIRRFGLHDNQSGSSPLLSDNTAAEVQQSLRQMPERSILDFLVRYFVTDVNWIDQMVYTPWFLAHYEKWWTVDSHSYVGDVEFAVLLLRISSYASEFLPSPAYTIDRVRGMPLAEIRSACDAIADRLAAICARLDSRGSLIRVQHIAFGGLKSACEGQFSAFWEALSCAIRVAQRVGIHQEPPAAAHVMDEIEKEMRRRSFCNLYIWDSLLSRKLDYIPFLPRRLITECAPRMRLMADVDDPDAPEEFTQRSLQARLVHFWRSSTPENGTRYDVILAEETYERFCNEFLPTLPSPFGLYPNQTWDKRLPTLPLQRQVLHINFFEFLCSNFRPSLLQEPRHVQDMPKYKQVLLSSQRKALAASALHLLEAASTLHAMMGASHTRYEGIIFPTFEAAVLLVSLCIDHDFSGNEEVRPNSFKVDPLGAGMASVSREKCMSAAQDALTRLRMLAEISSMAEVGARALTQLIERATASPAMEPESDDAIWSSMHFPELSTLSGLPDLLSLTDTGPTYSSWGPLNTGPELDINH
ncbi:hypothetical protein BDV23DRAFT_181267 [Aspergillus alliaceus]|uniref:Zn(2)-C6 fungal-type domain-containing protein n=1 Tax=Petromyces alliaceus TaxID=209559 RepID=A0A5N7CFB0_PETAA|nr:hypothetical protein BDV23DRAFT_181267 [Aspergillus alliaceus]